MKLALGENPKSVYHDRHETPMTRMATAAIIRETLSKAKEYAERLDRAAADAEQDKPDFDTKLDALLPVMRGQLPVHIHAHRADDIATGIRIAKEFGLRCVIVHGTEAHLIPELLEQENIPVITGPCLGDRSKPELANMTIESPHLLSLHKIKIAICTDHPETPIQYLPLCAEMAVKGGMDPEHALAAITIHPAEIAGIADRVGSLTPGKDADIVVTSGHPIHLLSQVQAVFIAGQRVTGQVL
jgi:imidazolonepropionase-like amidohydrolase